MECAIGGSSIGSWEFGTASQGNEKQTVYHTSNEGGVMCCGTPEIRSVQQLQVKTFDWATKQYVAGGASSFSLVGDTNFGIGQANNVVVMKGRDITPLAIGGSTYNVAIKYNGAPASASQLRYDFATAPQPPEHARTSCKLAMPKDSAAQSLVATAAASWPVRAEAQNQFVWLGGRWKNDRWEWDDGTPITGYTNWASGQPDTTSSAGATDTWLCMDRFTGKWHDCYGSSGPLIPLSTTRITQSNLQPCIGKCDRQSHCGTGLFCYKRKYDENVPGCTGIGGGSNWGYCYDPNANLGAMCEIEESPAKAPTWIHTPATMGDTEFNGIVRNSKHKIIRRVCPSCKNSHKDIYYKRLTSFDTFDYAEHMFNTWHSASHTNNQIHVDYNIFSTLETALADRGHSSASWRYNGRSYNGYAFPGYESGPVKAVSSQWASKTHGGQSVEFYVLDDAGYRDQAKVGLVHYYDFRGTASDLIGGAHALLQGGATFGSQGGDSYIELNGNAQYLTLPAESISDTMIGLYSYTVTMTIEPAVAKTSYLFDIMTNNLKDRM
jgi:hypothetical protein